MGGAVGIPAVISAIASVGGLGVNILGQRQQAQTAAAQARYRQQLASVHAGFREQDIKAEREREQVRQQLLARAEKQQRGRGIVALAALGQDPHQNPFTHDLSTEAIFQRALSQDESELRIRNIAQEVAGYQAQSALFGVTAESATAGLGLGTAGLALKTGARLTRDFTFKAGKFQFRA
jgi:hypothetical protein